MKVDKNEVHLYYLLSSCVDNAMRDSPGDEKVNFRKLDAKCKTEEFKRMRGMISDE